MKRKRESAGQSNHSHGVDTSKPTAVFQPGQGRPYTLSIALPGSIIANAQSHELKTTLAGQIARALAVFCVDEIVIFDDGQAKNGKPNNYSHNSNYHRRDESSNGGRNHASDDQAYTGYSDPDFFLAHLLSYLETPPHLRRYLFPLHPNLRTAGTLPSLDMPHHLRAEEWCQYREGVTIDDPSFTTQQPSSSTSQKSKKKKQKKSKTSSDDATVEDSTTTTTIPAISLVEAGLGHPVQINTLIPPNTRVTLKFPSSSSIHETELTAEAVSPDAPREEAGYYWGYSIRRAGSLSAVFTECLHDGGYDLTFGTSERGIPLSELTSPASTSPVPPFRHLLVVFGGVAGLEAAAKADPELAALVAEDGGPRQLFDYWVDLCPGQGSRTIRTEEAVWLGLMGLRGVVLGNRASEL
ncbi:MAG: hypothetical protein M1819_003699 [Sarea resinae]|nr:MAG: hypothetical protein M1819_003699 [Sarea resinae]